MVLFCHFMLNLGLWTKIVAVQKSVKALLLFPIFDMTDYNYINKINTSVTLHDNYDIK